jgi:hypothetical protein
VREHSDISAKAKCKSPPGCAVLARKSLRLLFLGYAAYASHKRPS